jgi:hypothetical protein
MATVREPAQPRAGARVDLVTAALLVAGATQVASGLLAFLAPGAFYDLVASYTPENRHFIKDLGSWQIGLGGLALYGARRADWRAPLLGLLALQYVLHTISHVVDAGQADTGWHDPFALITQGLGAILLTALFLQERAR